MENPPEPDAAISNAPAALAAPVEAEHRLTVLLFTDLVNSSGLKVKLGDLAYATKVARPHNDLFRTTLARSPGAREVNYTGDGFVAIFPNVAAAVETALLFHHALRSYPWATEPVQTRIGVHLGETVILNDGNDAGLTIASHAADLCARLMSLGLGGQTLLTRHAFDDARQYVRAHPALPDGSSLPELEWIAHGPYLFKGKDEPVEVFEVGVPGHAPLRPPPDAEKARRALRPGEEEMLGWRPGQGVEVPGRDGWFIEKKLGEGGFGEVWLARQAKLNRPRVFKFCFDEERLRSFKRELTLFRLIRYTLGEREDIARLYNVRLEAPPFFLESEFAEHGNLVDWCAAQGGAEQVPMERRLSILANVAEAVGAAHSVGILHKDLKPQNVLMQSRAGGIAAPQLTDFGISALADREALAARQITAAGFTENTLFRESGSSGTRLYAAPEQLAGKTYTVQGDIYALGVMLYQFVIGDFSRALAAGWERDVPDDLLREDIAECVDGDPARRPASAAELAERLRSFRARQTERQMQKAQKARNARRRRNTRLALAGSGVLAVTALVLGASLWREHGLRQRAALAERLAKDRLGQAERARDAAENLIADAIFGLREKLVPLGKIAVLDGMQKAAEDYYRSLPPELSSSTTRHHLVRLEINRALIAGARGDDDAGESAAQSALKMARALAADHPGDVRFLDDQTQALVMLGMLRYEQDALDEAEAFRAEAVRLANQWLALEPKAAQPRLILLEARGFDLVSLGDHGGDFSAALPAFAEMQKLSDELKALGAESLETATVDGIARGARGMVMDKMGNDLLAQSAYREADAAFEKTIAKYGEHPYTRQVQLVMRNYASGNLQKLASRSGDPELRKAANRQKFELVRAREKLTELEPQRLDWWKNLAVSCDDILRLVRQEGGPEAELAMAEKGYAAAQRATSPHCDRARFRTMRLSAIRSLVRLLLELKPAGWLARCRTLLAEAAAVEREPLKHGVRQNGGWLFTEVGNQWLEIGKELERAGNIDDALSEFRGLLGFRRSLMAGLPADYEVWRASVALAAEAAKYLVQHQHAAEAVEFTQASENWQREMIARFVHDPRAAADRVARSFDSTGQLLEGLKRAPADRKPEAFFAFEAQMHAFSSALEADSKLLKPADLARYHTDFLSRRGQALLEVNRNTEAETAFRECAAAAQQAVDLAPPEDVAQRKWDLSAAWLKLAKPLARLGRKQEAVKLLQDGALTRERIARESPSSGRSRDCGNAWKDVAEALEGSENREARVAAMQKAAQWNREGLHRAREAHASEGELRGCRVSTAWALQTLGYRLRDDIKRFAESEAVLRESLDLALEQRATQPTADLDSLRLLAFVRYDLAKTLLDARKSEEARYQTDVLDAEIAQHERENGGPSGQLENSHRWIAELRKRLTGDNL